MVKIVRLILYIIFITYFVGQYWFIFVEVLTLGYHKAHEEEGTMEMERFGQGEPWYEGDDKQFMKTIAAMYFALTSLSTVGFGDLYPRNDYERLLGSIMLLGGVTCFSYVLNELSYMMSNIKFLNGEFNDKEGLENFFVMLQKFNDGQLINHELQTRVAEFMDEKWSCDKNNFLITDHD